MFCYIYKERVLNINNKACVDLSLNSIDTESTAAGVCQFYLDVIIRSRTSAWSDTCITKKLLVTKGC